MRSGSSRQGHIWLTKGEIGARKGSPASDEREKDGLEAGGNAPLRKKAERRVAEW